MFDDFDKEIEEIKRIVNTDHTKQAVDLRRKTRNQLRRTTLQRNNAKRRKRRASVVLAIIIGFLAAVMAIILMTDKGDSEEKGTNIDIWGLWYYDQFTQYQFNENGFGSMYLDGGSIFEFNYKIEGNHLYLDFILEYVTDCEYTYEVNEDMLTLIGGEGTAVIGQIYTLSRK